MRKPIYFFLLFLSSIFAFFSPIHLQSYDYDLSYRDISLRDNVPIGVVLVAYNRPEYLIQVIESIEKNPEAATLPFFFMLDGGPSAKQEENAKIIQQSKIVHKEIIYRSYNYGCAKNLIDARRFMFDWCKFENVIVMEDDLTITPQYLGLLTRLHHWAKENYDNVGVVQAWTYCVLKLRNKKRQLADVVDSGHYWWSFVSYGIDRETWNLLSPILYEYESRFIDAIPQTSDFFLQRSKPGFSELAPEIRQWIKELVNQKQVNPIMDPQRQFKTAPIDYEAFFTSDVFEPHQDLMTGFALWMAGLIKIQTVVNRARHIGEVGITIHDQSQWKHFGFDQIKLHEFKTDNSLVNFKEIAPSS